MSKSSKIATVGKVLAAGATIVEGICAASVVDSALKSAQGNKHVNSIGRVAIGSLISTTFTAMAIGIMSVDTSDKDKDLRKLTIIDANCKKTKRYYVPGTKVTVDAGDFMNEWNELAYWYCTKGDVTFENERCQSTSFIMPDENVRIEFAVFGNCSDKDTEENIEDDSENVTVPDQAASEECLPKHESVPMDPIVIPDTVTSVGNDTFVGCGKRTKNGETHTETK